MAEAVFQDMVTKAGLAGHIQSDSAGTGSWHVGEPAHPGTLHVLRQNHIVYNGRARQFTFPDFERFDYIVAMDRENLSVLRRLGKLTGGKVSLFLHWAHEAGAVSVDEVPDPYYDNTFDRVYTLVKSGASALLDHIRAEYPL